MRKLIKVVLLVVVAIFYCGNHLVNVEAQYSTNSEEFFELLGDYEKRYDYNVNFMEKQFTDEKRLKLLLRPSYYIDSDNKDIITLSNEITRNITSDYDKARAIFDWVSENIYYDHDYIKNYGSLELGEYNEDGSYIDNELSSYVLKTKRGLCGGYTNLACALLRASGIPSQAYSGAVDTGEYWGAHGWSGAYIKELGRWIIFDTTFNSRNKYMDGQYIKAENRNDFFDMSIADFSKRYLNFIHIWLPEVDEEMDSEISELYGKTVDYTRNDLYFYFNKISMGVYNKRILHPGTASWDKEYIRFSDKDSWMSSNTEVAVVDHDGVVTALKPGKTTISLAYLDLGLVSSFELVVKPLKLSLYVSDLIVGEKTEVMVSEEGVDEELDYEIDLSYIKWKSSNTKIVKIDKHGQVTAVGKGTAKITASLKDGSSSKTVSIHVYPKLEKILISKKSLTVIPKETFDLTYELYPKGAYEGDQYAWEISDRKIVDFDSEYGFKALKTGTTDISISMIDWNPNDPGKDIKRFTVTCKVTVREPKKYKLTFDTKGGTNLKPLTILENSLIGLELKDPVRKGYEFTGWFKDSKCKNRWYFEEDRVKKNITLYAGWEMEYPCNIIYYTQMDNQYKSLINYAGDLVIQGSKLIEPKKPTKKGYKFVGWYDDTRIEYAKKWNFSKDRVMDSMLLVARFVKN